MLQKNYKCFSSPDQNKIGVIFEILSSFFTNKVTAEFKSGIFEQNITTDTAVQQENTK